VVVWLGTPGWFAGRALDLETDTAHENAATNEDKDGDQFPQDGPPRLHPD
jgi:hypothetical protein